MKYTLAIIAICASLLCYSQVDSIIMKNGARYGANLLEETDRYVRIETSPGSETKIPLPEIDRIFRCNIALDEVDALTHKRTVVLRQRNVGRKRNLQMVAIRVDDNFMLNISSRVDLGCVSEQISRVSMIFQDGETVELFHVGETDCSNRAVFSCLFADRDLQQDSNDKIYKAVQKAIMKKFRSKPLETIRLTGTDSYIDVKMNDRGKRYLMDNLGCLVDRF